ncbi:MAG: hypothetical protein GTN75_15415 [Gemmatimonadetes bacterium]|nr:hypothetical protein [Gemmatimonadota bacterium]
MVVGQVLIILAIAVLVTALLVGPLGWRRFQTGPVWDAAIFVLLMLYPALWVAKLWVRPVGPVLLGVHWVPLVFVGLIVAFIIGGTFPGRRRRRKEIVIGPDEPAWRVARKPFGFFFWFLMLLYLSALIAGHNRGASPFGGT